MKSFKAFIKSWYYFLKEEKWVARTFMVIVVLIALFINNITESWFYYDHDVLEYGAIKKYSLSFDIIAQKLYNRLEEEISADPNVTGLRAFLDGDEISYWCMYDDDTNGETIILPLTLTEKQSAKNIQEKTFTLEGRYPGSIGVWKSQVANTDANEPFARRIQTSKTVYLNQGNGRLNQAKQRQAIQYNWIKPH